MDAPLKSLMYVRMRLESRVYTERERHMIQQAALSPVTFSADNKPAYQVVTIPWALAKLVQSDNVYGGISVFDIVTGEELSLLAQAVDKIVFNETTGSCVPSDAVTRVRDVKLLPDACTDALQDHLNEGWSILAVCPQPQRRPDYILGRIPPPDAASLLACSWSHSQERVAVAPTTEAVGDDGIPF